MADLHDEDEVRKISDFSPRFYSGVRKALGENRGDMAIQRDRFILQADIVFAPFTDTMTRPGRSVMLVLTRGLTKITDSLPDDLRARWTLQLDMHSCASDLLEAQFDDAQTLTEAQLSKIRKFLAEQGFVGDRVLLNAYGDTAPMDARENDRAYRKNRRLEFRLADPDEPTPADQVELAEPKDEIGWRQIDHDRERKAGPAGKPADVLKAPPPPKTMTLDDLHGSFDDVARREGEALKKQKEVAAPEESDVGDVFTPFPDDFVLPDLERFAAFRTGMVVFEEKDVDADGKPLDAARPPSMIQHALSTV